ncbi:glycosyltransferase [Halorhodospira sp. 9622]|uniref:glycosyltransferase n=1 Tax=Halorhodospira sp. 9622 TaxID=2899136 RepID=UPI001EE94F75|nr:glycosyltransferase [Halorhodospira sp. 9622]MCG5539066.1 putative rhamnosyl transferase [Halorhodospira sp. 9622]
MKKIIYFIVRYSLLTNAGTGNGLAKAFSFERYRKKLFNPNRLLTHERLFCRLVMPTFQGYLRRMGSAEPRMLIFTSSELPEPFKKRLFQITEKTQNLSLQELPVDYYPLGGHVSKAIRGELDQEKNPTIFSTVHWDDDDALSIDYADRLSAYMTEQNIGNAVSFGKGFGLPFSTRKAAFSSPALMRYPFVSAGLSHINSYNKTDGFRKTEPANVMEIHPHTKADTFCPTIVDSREPSYIKTYHNDSVQGIKKGRRRLLNLARRKTQMDAATLSILEEHFDVDIRTPLVR